MRLNRYFGIFFRRFFSALFVYARSELKISISPSEGLTYCISGVVNHNTRRTFGNNNDMSLIYEQLDKPSLGGVLSVFDIQVSSVICLTIGTST